MVAENPEWVAYRNSRPTKRMGAGLLIRDSSGRILLVEPAYKPTWEVPGGVVELDECPRMACQREAAEELGLDLAVGEAALPGMARPGVRED